TGRCTVTFEAGSAPADAPSSRETFAMQLTNNGMGEMPACEPINGARPLLFGYGCRRGAALGANDSIERESAFSHVATLFSESARLPPARSWLVDLRRKASQSPEDAHIYELVTEKLCQVLPSVTRFDIVDDKVWVIAPDLGGRVPLGALS